MRSIVDNLGAELVSAIIGAIFGSLCTFIGFMGKQILQRIRHIMHIKRMKKTEFLFDENLNI